jgi:hypothetical protein
MGQPQEIPVARQPGGFLDKILGLYGDDPNTHIPQHQRQGALKRGLRDVSQALLSSGGRGHDSLTAGQAIGGALNTLQGTGARMGAENQQYRIQQMLQSGQLSPTQMQAILQEMLAAGDYKGAALLTSMLNNQGQNATAKVGINPETGKPEHVFLRPGESPEFTGAQAPGEAGSLSRFTAHNPKTGKSELAVMDSNGNVQWLGLEPPRGTPTELEYRAGMFIPLAEEAERVIQSVESVPGRINQILNATSINELQAPEFQQFYVAGNQLGDAYLRLTSGAAIKQEEVDMFVKSFLPYPGDSPETAALKRRQRGNFIRGLRVIGGSAVGNVGAGSTRLQRKDFVDDVIAAGEQALVDELSSGFRGRNN